MFHINIEKETLKNKHYRKVIYTDKFQQLVLMSLNAGEFIHLESHKATQFFRIEQGKGIARIYIKQINGTNKKKKSQLKTFKSVRLNDGKVLIVPPNTKHFVENTGDSPLKLYTIYSPPQHHKNTLHKRQSDDDEF